MNASEGELLRDQLAECIESSRTRPDYGVREGFDGSGPLKVRFVGAWDDLSAERIADALLTRFDVRLREPQEEETR